SEHARRYRPAGNPSRNPRPIPPAEITQNVRNRGFMLWSFVHGLSFLLYDDRLAESGGDFDLDFLLADIAERVLTD
ncbi:MAG: hypothetical protein AAFW87_12905, partial [Pseudomonadota bacterium]